MIKTKKTTYCPKKLITKNYLLNKYVIHLKIITVPVKCKLTVTRNSNDSTRSSILETWTFRGSRLESSFETFEAVREFIESSFETFEWKKQRTFCAINFWHVWIGSITYFSFLYRQIYFEFRYMISHRICLSENWYRSFSFFNLFHQNLSWILFTK